MNADRVFGRQKCKGLSWRRWFLLLCLCLPAPLQSLDAGHPFSTLASKADQ